VFGFRERERERERERIQRLEVVRLLVKLEKLAA